MAASSRAISTARRSDQVCGSLPKRLICAADDHPSPNCGAILPQLDQRITLRDNRKRNAPLDMLALFKYLDEERSAAVTATRCQGAPEPSNYRLPDCLT